MSTSHSLQPTTDCCESYSILTIPMFPLMQHAESVTESDVFIFLFHQFVSYFLFLLYIFLFKISE